MLSCSGYAGKVVRIDLSGESMTEYPWDDSDRERYLGGKTMAARILRDCLTGQEAAFFRRKPCCNRNRAADRNRGSRLCTV